MKNSVTKTTTSRLAPPPEGLSDNAKAFWTKMVSEWPLEDAATLLNLKQIAEDMDRRDEARADIKANGTYFKDRFGQEKTRPSVLIERDAGAAVRRGIQSLHLDVEPLNDGPGRPLRR